MLGSHSRETVTPEEQMRGPQGGAISRKRVEPKQLVCTHQPTSRLGRLAPPKVPSPGARIQVPHTGSWWPAPAPISGGPGAVKKDDSTPGPGMRSGGVGGVCVSHMFRRSFDFSKKIIFLEDLQK